MLTKKRRSEVMRSIRSGGNKTTELKLASIFRAHGIKGWRRRQRVPGKPDFVFWRERIALFVDGCFWHGCPVHCRRPSSNRDYWLPKILRNQKRDTVVRNFLKKGGWRVLRVWEHDLWVPSRLAGRIALAVRVKSKKRSLHQKML